MMKCYSPVFPCDCTWHFNIIEKRRVQPPCDCDHTRADCNLVVGGWKKGALGLNMVTKNGIGSPNVKLVRETLISLWHFGNDLIDTY